MLTALVVYIEARPTTVLFRAPRERIGGKTVLATVLERCSAGLSGRVDEQIVLSESAGSREWLEPVVKASTARLVTGDYDGILSAISHLGISEGRLETILLLPEGAIFPDCQLTLALLQAHLSAGADLTVSTETPIGLLPLAFNVRAVDRLRTVVPQPRSCEQLFTTLADIARFETRSLPDWILKFSLKNVESPILERLPERVLITNEHSRRAAERVASRADTFQQQDSRPACAMKQELRRDDGPIVNRSYRTLQPRVLFSSLQNAFSGGEESLYQLISHLEADRYAPVAWMPTPTILSHRLSDCGIPVEIADRDRHSLTAGNLRYFDELVVRVQPSVIHVDGYVNPALMAVGQLRKIPVVSHVRMVLDPRAQVELASADAIISISAFVSSALKKRDLPAGTIHTIYNGVDLSVFAADDVLRAKVRAQRGFGEKDRVISLVGRIVPQKRQHILIEALARLRERLCNIHVMMIGEVYSQSYFHDLHQLAKKFRCESSVHWLGFCPSVREILAASDVLVLCSRFEPFGRCIIEAMAMGIPCVVPNSGGPPEIVRAGRDGLVFDAQSSESLTESLSMLLSDDGLRDALGRAARHRASVFDIQSHARNVAGLYDSLRDGCKHAG